MCGYSNPLVTFPDWKCIDFNGFGCLDVRFEFEIEHRNQPRSILGSNRARCIEKYTNLTAQGCIWDDFAPPSLKIASGMQFSLQNDPSKTALIGRLSSFGCAFEATARLGWAGWVASASLSEITVRWAASAMPSKSLGGRLQCFKLCFARLHWRRKAPMRI